MKNYFNDKRFKDLNTDEEIRKEVANCYQSVLCFITKAIGPINVADEPLLCAALETFSSAVKAQMPKEGLEIYEDLKKLSVKAVSNRIKK